MSVIFSLLVWTCRVAAQAAVIFPLICVISKVTPLIIVLKETGVNQEEEVEEEVIIEAVVITETTAQEIVILLIHGMCHLLFLTFFCSLLINFLY